MLFQKLNIPRKSFTFLPTPRFSHSPTPTPASPHPHPLTIHLLLSASTSDLKSLLRHHALIITSGHSTNPFFAAKLISLYASFNRPDLSTRVFNTVPQNLLDNFLWNSIIKTHFSDADLPLSLCLYHRMRASGAPPDQFTVPMVVSACAELLDLGFGSCVHATSMKFGLFTGDSVGIGSSLVYLYSKCSAIGDAFRMFDEMPIRDVVSWTALIIGCVRNEECELGLVYLKEMHCVGGDGGVRPNSRTIEGGLEACGSLGALKEGKLLHGFSIKDGTWCCRSIKSSLLSMYTKCESLEETVLAFSELPEKDIISWTAIVRVHLRKGLIGKCLEWFCAMLDSGIQPDGILISCMLMGFMNSASVSGGKALHGIILRRNFKFDAFVANSLLLMYCTFELVDLAERVFYTICERDAESWNLMVFGYGKIGLDIKCLDLFREMQSLGLGLESDLNSLVSVISSCSKLGALCLGQSVHCYSIKNAADGDASVSNALVGMYGRCGRLDISRRIFDRTSRDVVTWNSLITAYAHLGHSNDALLLFDQMLLDDVRPNSKTLMSVLSACSHIAALQQGMWIHDYIKEMGLECDVSLCTALVDMYAKCGQLKTSRLIFDSMPERDVVSWNVMTSAYGIHGSAKEALEIFGEMEKTGVSPNDVTILALLSACSHGGLVEEGKHLFFRMKEYSVAPTLKHYACMVDLLGRSGNLHEAETMVLTMPIVPDGAIWGALLGACKMHSNVEMGERVAKRAFESDPENDGYYILMSNMYSCCGRWEKVEMLREMMKNKGVRKRAGWSALELDEQIHVFTVGDISHLHSEELNTVLEALCRQMEQ